MKAYKLKSPRDLILKKQRLKQIHGENDTEKRNKNQKETDLPWQLSFFRVTKFAVLSQKNKTYSFHHVSFKERGSLEVTQSLNGSTLPYSIIFILKQHKKTKKDNWVMHVDRSHCLNTAFQRNNFPDNYLRHSHSWL